jgi:hypothetical protein
LRREALWQRRWIYSPTKILVFVVLPRVEKVVLHYMRDLLWWRLDPGSVLHSGSAGRSEKPTIFNGRLAKEASSMIEDGTPHLGPVRRFFTY